MRQAAGTLTPWQDLPADKSISPAAAWLTRVQQPSVLTDIGFFAWVLDVCRELGKDVTAHIKGLLVLGAQVWIP